MTGDPYVVRGINTIADEKGYKIIICDVNGRPDILSYGDLAILRGMRMVYHHRKITRELFEKYRRRYSPYGSVASLYLWAVAGGVIEGMKDYAPKTVKKK